MIKNNFFLRLSKYSDRNWKSYRMPKEHEWGTEDLKDVEDMIEAGAIQVNGLAGIEWNKPYFDDEDVVFAEDSPIFADGEGEDLTANELIRNGYILRLYNGKLIETIQDGCIFQPMPLTEAEAEKIANKWDVEIYPEDYSRGLLQADGSTMYFNFDEIFDR